MSKIIKVVELNLTKEECESPEEIEIQFTVKEEGEEMVTYTITYPKG